MDLRALQRIEEGQKKLIHPDLLKSIADALEKSFFDFFPVEKLSIGINHSNTGGISNEHVITHSIADEIRGCYADIIAQLRYALAEEKRLSAEKDNISREQRAALIGLRKIVADLRQVSGK